MVSVWVVGASLRERLVRYDDDGFGGGIMVFSDPRCRDDQSFNCGYITQMAISVMVHSGQANGVAVCC